MTDSMGLTVVGAHAVPAGQRLGQPPDQAPVALQAHRNHEVIVGDGSPALEHDLVGLRPELGGRIADPPDAVGDHLRHGPRRVPGLEDAAPDERPPGLCVGMRCIYI